MTFQASRLKIERAKKHINDLNQMVSMFAIDSYRLSIEPNIALGYELLKIETSQPLPIDFPLILGDVLHNLKSSLDLTINAIVFNRLGFYDDYTRFPMRKTRNELVHAINGGLIQKASRAVADYIVDVIKPYKGGNDAIWALHELNILDKHRLLLPFMQVTSVDWILAEDDRGQEIRIDTWVITNKRTAVHPCIGHRNVKIKNKGQPAILVLFHQGLPLEGQPIIPTLNQLTELVSGVLEGIEKVFRTETT